MDQSNTFVNKIQYSDWSILKYENGNRIQKYYDHIRPGQGQIFLNLENQIVNQKSHYNDEVYK
jgi:hypothetical protein